MPRKIIVDPTLAPNGHPAAPTPDPIEPVPHRRARRAVASAPPPDDLADLADPAPAHIPAWDAVAPPAAPAAAPVPSAPPDAQAQLARVMNSIVSQDPERLYRELEAAERPRGRSLAILLEELEGSLPNASKASRLAMIATRAARLYKEVELPKIEAALRDRARGEMPRRENKDGSEKAPSVQELTDWIATTYAAEASQARVALINLETLADHASDLARVWSYRSRDLQEMSANLRAQGDGVTRS